MPARRKRAIRLECRSQPGAMHVNENEFIVEVIDPMTEEATAPEAKGELVITNLGRLGSPVIRYRTGDLVQANRQPCPCGRAFILLEGGVLGRIDDMIVIRGINVFPSAIENVLREFAEIEEFRIEPSSNQPCARSNSLSSRLRIRVRALGWRKKSRIGCANASGFAPKFNWQHPVACPASS